MAFRTLILFTLFAALVMADFDKNDIDDTYIRRTGDPDKCPREIEFEDDDLSLEADEIELDENDCRGGRIVFTRNPSNTKAEKYFRDDVRRDRVGDFLSGTVSNDINCGPEKLSNGEKILLLETEEDVQFRWRDLFGENSELAKRDGGIVELDDDTKYLILGSKCFYEERNPGNICFPASASVRVRSGQVKRMDELQIGDEVEVGGGKFSAVFAWTHRTGESARSYVRIETEGGLKVVVTPTHYVYAGGKAVPARKVRVGDVMKTGEGDEVKVVSVRNVREKGLYNPQTMEGDIVVDGLLVTTFTTTVQPMAGHALLAPIRAAYSMFGWGLSIGVSA